jgi:predicted negative regulator of RcsB-dependent stress response
MSKDMAIGLAIGAGLFFAWTEFQKRQTRSRLASATGLPTASDLTQLAALADNALETGAIV